VSASLRRVLAASALIAAAVVLLAGCGGSQPAYCQDKTALKKSVDNLKDVSIGKGAMSELQSNVSAVKSDAQTLASSAKKDFGPQAQALETAVASLGTAVQTAVSSPSGQAAATVAAGVTSVKSAFTDLSSAVSSKC
jgi:ABC-type transporter MlaC component